MTGPLLLPPKPATVPWRVAGRYFEACSCEAICPCRSVDGAAGGKSTYGTCEFALGWSIDDGAAGDLDLSGFEVVMAGWYDDHEPGSPWRVVLYLDERASPEQRQALEAIYLGRAGGTTLANFAAGIGEVLAVRAARITIDHTRGRRRIGAENYVEVVEQAPVATDATVSCGIPGHDQPGEEIVADRLAVHDTGLDIDVRGRCAFATRFRYAGPD